ncbi:MAG: lipoate--protein ligase family protein [Alkalibacterium sp.]|nr:lipoate--protein ligase family protein [Alkalibacterium sp.]
MTTALSFLTEYNTPFLLYDELPSFYMDHPYAPFALTDAFIKEAGDTSQPILHFWQTPPLIILGMMDTKLPFLNEALPSFATYSYPYIVRNSGGLAVVGDEGVLNFSMVFPEGDHRLPIDEAYSRMHQVIQLAFSSFKTSIDAYEIKDSYCPGDFDLSIDGRKIAGISQRRIRGGIAIMIYLSVSGDQHKRAQMIREFYDKGLKGTETKWTFPVVDPEVMTTLEEAFDTPMTIDNVKQRILAAFDPVPIQKGDITPSITESYKEGFEKMTTRNDKLLP